MIPFETFLAVRSAAGGALSPDGRRLAFLMDTPGVPQVYRMDRPGQEPAQLTDTGQIVRSVHWSPDGRWLLFSMDEGGSEQEKLYLLNPDGSARRLLTPAPNAIHTFGAWSPDSRRVAFASNRRDAAFFDIYVLDLESVEEQCVLRRDAYFNALDWSPDASQILVRQHLASFDHDLFLLDLRTNALRPVTPHTGDARYLSARFLPDGKTLLLCTDQDRDFLALALLDTETLQLSVLLEEQVDVESCDTAADGSRLAAVLNAEGWSELLLANLDNGALSRVSRMPLPGVVSSCRMARDGSRVALALAGPSRNSNVWVIDAVSRAAAQWTQAPTAGLNMDLLVEPRAICYPAHDGMEIPAFLYRPRDAASGPTPVIVHVHGGPESQDRPDFRAVYQYLVHRGYAVLAPNVRGSTGYGNLYCHLDDREKRYDALRDVEHAYRWLISSGVGDPRRIGIMGGSYGGFTVLACLTRQPDLWAVGVDIVGVANFETFFQHTGPWRRHLRASEYGDPVRDAALLRDLSPIHAVERIKAPLMVIQGANDPRVPQEESDQMVEKLRARGHPVEYLLFPDEGHGITRLPNRIKAYTAIGEFLDRHLGVGS